MSSVAAKGVGGSPGLKVSGKALLRAVEGSLPAHASSPGYQVGLVLVAMVMLLIPVVYLALVAAVGFGVWWHATHHWALVESARGGRAVVFAAFVYMLPLLVGPVVVLFLLKPFVAPRADDSVPLSIDRGDEPALFAFIDRLCAAVGAPAPVRIDVDCQANASAGFRGGLMSLLRGDLVLTIGLPLAATMNVREFAGVLAHEFGHFRQAGAMRLVYLVRTLNGWIERSVYQRDRWDQWLLSLPTGYWPVWMAVASTRGLLWLSRRVLWVLMMLGHASVGFMLREMEYDADRTQIEFAGSEAFVSAMQRFPIIMISSSLASESQRALWQDRRLADDLVALIAHHDAKLTASTARQGGVVKFDEAPTGWFDSDPSTSDRIAAARELATPGIFRVDAPAQTLFRDFGRVCRLASAFVYQHSLGEAYEEATLTPAADLLQTQALHDRALDTLRAYTQEALLFSEPLWPALEQSHQPVDAARARGALKQARDYLVAKQPTFAQATTDAAEAHDAILNYEVVRDALRRANVPIKTDQRVFQPGHESELTQWLRRAERSRELAVQQLAKPWEVIEQRLIVALRVLRRPANLPGLSAQAAAKLQRRLTVLQETLEALEEQRERIAWLERRRGETWVLINQLTGEPNDEAVGRALEQIAEQTFNVLHQLQRDLGRLDYPFPHPDGSISLGGYLVPQLPGAEQLGDLMAAAESAHERFRAAAWRTLAHLTVVAVQVERALGLEPLPMPTGAAPAADDAADAGDRPRARKPGRPYLGLGEHSKAGEPGRLSLCHKKLRQRRPEWYGPVAWLRNLLVRLTRGVEHKRLLEAALEFGDSRAAVVVSVQPLLVAAYSSEFDAVVMLRFDEALARQYNLRVGSRLVTVNTYGQGGTPDPDITRGPRALPTWDHLHPTIADFITDDPDRLAQIKRRITEEE